jgi:hypothetical protein
MSKKASTKLQSTPREIALEVPKNINLVEMSAKEIDKLAQDMARKAASSLPANSALLGVDRLTLTNSASPQVGVWGEWSRGCGRPRDVRDDITINPDVFVSPVESKLGKLTKKTITGSRLGTKGKKASSKKGSKKTAAKKRK